MLRMVRLWNKNVLRPDRSDIVPARNSTSTCSGTTSQTLMFDFSFKQHLETYLFCVSYN